MGFVYKKSRNPNGGRELMEFTLKSSATFTIGDALKLASGVLDLAGAGGALAGILTGIIIP